MIKNVLYSVKTLWNPVLVVSAFVASLHDYHTLVFMTFVMLQGLLEWFITVALFGFEGLWSG